MSATPPYDGTKTNRHVLPENITISASENMSGFRESGVLQGLQASQIFRSRDLCPQTIPVDYRLRAMVCLGGRHPAPERTGIGSIPMKLHHPVEEFAHARRLLVEAQEVPQVAASFFDDPRVVVVLGPFVTGAHRARLQQFHVVYGSDSFCP